MEKDDQEIEKKLNQLNNRLNKINNNEVKLRKLLVNLNEELLKNFVIDDNIVGKDEVESSINRVDEILNNR